MEVIANLFSQFSIEAIILFLIAIGLSLKFIGELWDYFYAKLKKYFNYSSQKDQQHQELLQSIVLVKKDIEQFNSQQIELKETINAIKKNMSVVNERLQEASRNTIIDKHHYFCYEIGAIDDLSLQSLEREYLYYKSAGGNSFIDGLMDEIRSLPRLKLKPQQRFKEMYERGEK